jgi:hypothetical protein
MSLVLSSSNPRVRVKTYGFAEEVVTITCEDQWKPPFRQVDVPIKKFLQMATSFFQSYVSGQEAPASIRMCGDRVLMNLAEGCLFDVAACDLFHMIRYVMTNTDVRPNDPRHQFFESCKSLPRPKSEANGTVDVMIRFLQDAKIVPGFNTHLGNNSTRYQV